MTKSKKSVFIVLASFIALCAIVATCYVIYAKSNKNIFSNLEFSPSFVDRDGRLLNVYLTSDDKYRIYTSITRYPTEFLDIILLQEDQYFFSHHGFNPISLWKAFVQTYVKKGSRVGGSTITMQVAKLKYHIYTKNIAGKLKQIFAAMYLEAIFSKQEIFDFYLNLAPCGKNLEGFEAASWFYFNKSVSALNLTEMTTLCVLPQSPTSRTPSKNHFPDELQTARKNLFEKWLKEHPEDENKRIYFELKPNLVCKMCNRTIHFTRLVASENTGKNIATKTKSTQFLLETTKTTLDLSLQTKCESFLASYINQNAERGVHNGAMILYDWTTMEVLAAIGSKDYYDDAIEGQVNALSAKRSPGSTLKPFIYGQALDQGLIHSHTMLKDTPVTFNEYAPDNYGSVYKGPVFSWFALVDSRNIPAIYLASKIKNPDLYDYLKKSGVTNLKDKNHYGLSIVLGSAEVTMLELARLYSSLPNAGVQKELKMTKNVFTDSKKDKNATSKQMLSKESAFIVMKMLEKNAPPIQNRPQETKNIPISYKTGTSVGFKDCWCAMIFDRYVLIVWLGNFDGLGNDAFLGRTMAAPLAFRIADSILMEKGESTDIKAISGNVKQVDVCSTSGALPNENCFETEKCYFIPGVSPITKCKIHRKINIDTRTGYRTDEEEGKFVVSSVREFWPQDILDLFALAGLPRLTPPSYPSEDLVQDTAKNGFAPQILSPMANTNYCYRADDFSKNHIVLQGSCDSDSDELLWFCGDKFIARTKPLEKFVWQPQKGSFLITVIDSKARSTSVRINITYTQ